MATTLVLERIAAWERAGLIDHALALRLREAETAEPVGAEMAAGAGATGAGATGAGAAALIEVLGEVPASPARARSSGFILEFFAYLGGLFLLLAWYAWFVNDLPASEALRHRSIAIATLAPALLLGFAGWILAARDDDHLRRAAAIAFAVAIPNAGVGAWALLRASVVPADGEAAAVAIGAGVALGAAALARVRRPSAITQAALLAGWGVFALALASWVEGALWNTAVDDRY